jgi:molecular chaperone IbpA
MTKFTHLDLAPFYRNSIGVDRLFDRITAQIDSAAAGNYPPYDIVKTSDNSYEIRVAVAGFCQAEIDVTFHDGQLIITGEKNRDDDNEHEYLHHGISARKFARTFSLADYVEVQSANAKDGILTVYLQRIVPESAKPKKIAITHSDTAQ